MKVANIKSVYRKKKHNYPKSTAEITAKNMLNRKFNANYSNEKWLTDVTEFKYASCHKAYLSAILDLVDHRIAAYKVSKFNNNAIVFNNFDEEIALNPGVRPILHSDRRFQYTSKIFKNKLDNLNITQSISRVGRCIDNGPM